MNTKVESSAKIHTAGQWHSGDGGNPGSLGLELIDLPLLCLPSYEIFTFLCSDNEAQRSPQ